MTVQEVEAKEVGLVTERDTALAAAKELEPGSIEFDQAYNRYSAARVNLLKIPDELVAAKQQENAGEIAAAKATIVEGIETLLVGLNVSDLLGTKIRCINYTVDAEDKGGLAFNPIVKSPAKMAPRESKSGGRTMIALPDGTKQSPTKFVLAHATEAEKATFSVNKPPHLKVDTKPKFDAFCIAHNLTGYTYEMPAPTAS